MLLLLTAFILGAAHAVAPDHLAAVGVFVSRSRSTREAFAQGAHWGVGHALTLTLAGMAVLFVAAEWPQLLSIRAEWLVGAVLIVLGARTLWRAMRADAEVGSDVALDSVHTHADGTTHHHTHSHRHPLLGIGMLHGLAGSGAMAAVVPLSAGQHPVQATIWLALFGAGTIAAMACIAAVAGWTMRGAAYGSARGMRLITGTAGASSIGVGLLWLARTPL